MPLTPRPLAPLALRLVEIPGIPRVRGVQAVGLARLPTLIRGGASPLRRAAEQHPAQHRDLLRQLRDPGIGLRERLLGPLGTLTPVRHISGVTGHRREGHVLQNTPSPSNTPRTAPGVSRTKPQPRRRPRLQTHAALTPHVTTGGHSDSARPPTGSPNTYAASSSGPLSAPGLGRSGAFQMSPPTRLAMSCRIGSVRCWYRAAMPVLDHPMIPMTARSATPRIKKHRCCGVPGVV